MIGVAFLILNSALAPFMYEAVEPDAVGLRLPRHMEHIMMFRLGEAVPIGCLVESERPVCFALQGGHALPGPITLGCLHRIHDPAHRQKHLSLLANDQKEPR